MHKFVFHVGQKISHPGPHLFTCRLEDPPNILSVGATYVVGIGGPCSSYSEWTPYSQYPPEHRQALFNRCSNASTIMPSVTIVFSIIVTICIINHLLWQTLFPINHLYFYCINVYDGVVPVFLYKIISRIMGRKVCVWFCTILATESNDHSDRL